MKMYIVFVVKCVFRRPDKNARRVRYGCERLCMPPVPEDIFMEAVKSCVLANAKWVPPCGQGSLYIRPLVIGTGPIREYLIVPAACACVEKRTLQASSDY